MVKAYYINLRNKYIPKNLKTIFILESPPVSGRYFYDKTGEITEPLFSAMMQCVLKENPINKSDGLENFAKRGHLIVDAVYEPINNLRKNERDKIIIREYCALIEDLKRLITSNRVKIILIKANICSLLENRLLNNGFNVRNNHLIIPFPSHGWQKEFCKKIRRFL